MLFCYLLQNVLFVFRMFVFSFDSVVFVAMRILTEHTFKGVGLLQKFYYSSPMGLRKIKCSKSKQQRLTYSDFSFLVWVKLQKY